MIPWLVLRARSRVRGCGCAVVLAGAAGVASGCGPYGDTPPSAAEGRGAIVARVEHFYATSPNADRLFHFFRDSLGLPEVWAFQRWGGFASGGVTLGNVVLELVEWTPDDGAPLPVEFSGIALEPVQHTDSLLAELARRGVRHTEPDTSYFDSETGVTVGWVNTMLSGMLPQPRSVFFCDYWNRAMVARGRRAASDQLAATGGGPLGVIGLREILVSAVDVGAARARWRSLLDTPSQEVDGTFSFAAGPSVRVLPGPEDAIVGIVVQVRSLEEARTFLAEHGWLGGADESRPSIESAAMEGLHVTLSE